jgi:hypothetical protein
MLSDIHLSIQMFALSKKCHLFCKKVVYLGHVISEAGIATDPEKTKIVNSWPVPTNVKELRSFMGFSLPSTPNIGRVSKTSSYQINDQMSHQCVVMGRHH